MKTWFQWLNATTTESQNLDGLARCACLILAGSRVIQLRSCTLGSEQCLTVRTNWPHKVEEHAPAAVAGIRVRRSR